MSVFQTLFFNFYWAILWLPLPCNDPVNNCRCYSCSKNGAYEHDERTRNNDITQQEIESWMDEAEMGMENALKTNPKDIEQLYQKKIDDLHAAYGEAMLENKFLKKLHSHLESTED